VAAQTPSDHASAGRLGTAGGDLARGRAAVQERRWSEAFAELTRADRAEPLAAGDLEQLALAAYLIGHEEDCLATLRRAHQQLVDQGEHRHAARCAFWLAFVLLDRGEATQAGGWLSRADRLLERVPECSEHGYVLLPRAVQQVIQGNHESARELAARALEIGGRVGSADVTAMARLVQGRSHLAEGELDAGLALLDEAMVAVLADEVSPLLAGTIYCSVIEGCQEVSEVRRATDWTRALTEWCDAQPDLVMFTGNCLIHRAEILQLRGDWPAAEAQARQACERLAAAADRFATGSARYRQGEVYRARGEFAAAESAYEQASEWGYEPQPGLALLRLAQGEVDVATAAIRRVVGETGDRIRRAKLLPAMVEIMLAGGDVQAARAAVDELAGITRDYDTMALRATADGALGAVLLAEGAPRDALRSLRQAWRAWQDLDAPYEAARLRVLIGLACRELGDEEGATLDVTAARRVFASLGAAPDVARVESLTRSRATPAGHGLSPRELEVLRLVATGMTNRAIGRELVLAERTVDRHVSNIFAKLGVSSRAAATAYAHRHRLI
jgi:ATP/maltotriose-dependent transcriptional regulator MalT